MSSQEQAFLFSYLALHCPSEKVRVSAENISSFLRLLQASKAEAFWALETADFLQDDVQKELYELAQKLIRPRQLALELLDQASTFLRKEIFGCWELPQSHYLAVLRPMLAAQYLLTQNSSLASQRWTNLLPLLNRSWQEKTKELLAHPNKTTTISGDWLNFFEDQQKALYTLAENHPSTPKIEHTEEVEAFLQKFAFSSSFNK